MVELRLLPATDLNVKYVRDMGNNKLRHYVVPTSLLLVKKFMGQGSEDIIREYLQKVEGETNIVFKEPEILIGPFIEDAAALYETRQYGSFTITDVSKIVLDKDKDIGRALNKVHTQSTLYQWNYYPTVFHEYYDRFVWLYNRSVVPFVNKILYKLQGLDYEKRSYFAKQLRYLSQIYIREVSPVRFIAIGFEAKNAQAAMDAMLNDLRILQKHKLIMGHLAMPSTMPLVDTVGAGNYFVMFCFLPLNGRKLLKSLGKKDYFDMPAKDQLVPLGVKYEVAEGDFKWLNGVEPKQIYNVEEVVITDVDADERRQIYLDSYNNSVDHVNSIAKAAREDLKNLEKVQSRIEHQFVHTIEGHKNLVIMDTMVKNNTTGKIISIAEEYNRNG